MSDVKIHKSKLRLLFADVLRGYSTVINSKYPSLLIKHLNPFDVADLDIKTEIYTERAKQKGIPTNTEKEEQLKKDDIWPESKNKEIKDLKFYLEGLDITLTKVITKEDKEGVRKQIIDIKAKISTLEREKIDLIGFTADVYAAKKVNEYFIFNSLYKENLSCRLFQDSEFDELEESDINDLVEIYNKTMESFNTLNLQRIALAPFFLNQFYLASDSVMDFWGKPIIQLTGYQLDLTSYGKYFKNMLSSLPSRPDDEKMDNPDKLIEWFNASQNLNKIVDKVDNKGEEGIVGIVGMTGEEISNNLGGKIKNANKELFDKLKKSGKNRLEMSDLLNS